MMGGLKNEVTSNGSNDIRHLNALQISDTLSSLHPSCHITAISQMAKQASGLLSMVYKEIGICLREGFFGASLAFRLPGFSCK